MGEKEKTDEKKAEMVSRFKEFIHRRYGKEINKAALEELSLEIDFKLLSRFSSELADLLLDNAVFALACFREAVESIDLPGPVNVRFFNHPSQMNIRDLRSRNLRKFVCIEGTVRKASEIRPEIMSVSYECPDCGDKILIERKGNFIGKPFQCSCGNRKDFKKLEEKMIDTRWIVIEEPFELTEGDRPSQMTILLTDDLVSTEGRRITDPGNRIRITGALMEIPKGKSYSAKLDFYLDANHVEAVEIGWHNLNITKEEEEEIKKLAASDRIYETFVDSLAPTLYGLREIKESIILQLFGGVPQLLKDGNRLRGDIHILIIGDPASGKSQLLKMVPEIVPRGRYVSGKGVSVDYDDPVMFMENGRINTELMGRVIDKYYKKDEHGVFVPVKNIRVPSFDHRTFKIEWRPVGSVFRHTIDEPIHKLTLRTGRELRVTGGHSVFLLDNGKIMTKEAKDIKSGDYVVLPSSIPTTKTPQREINLLKEFPKLSKNDKKNMLVISKNKRKMELDELKDSDNPGKYALKCRFSDHEVPAKTRVGKELMWLLGYYIADGSLTIDSSLSRKVKFDVSAKDTKIIDKLVSVTKSLFNIEPRVYKRKDSECFNIYIYDKIVYLLFKEILKVGTSASTKKVPELVFNVSPELQMEFIKGWFDGDYGVTISKNLMSDIMYLYSMNKSIATFSRRRIKRIVRFPDGHESNVDREVYQLKAPVPFKKFKNKHSYPPLSQFKLGFADILQRNQYARASPTSNKVIFSKFRKLLFDRLALIKENSTPRELMKSFGMRNIKSCRDYMKTPIRLGLVNLEKGNNRSFYNVSKKGKRVLERYNEFMKIFNSDFGFVQVINNEKIKSTGKHVYDFSVDGCENFIAGFGGVVCHNTGAGLTATVTKDEQFMGGWVLEAGALVLSNKGLLAIDEFEKMSVEDQVAMHEALEQGTISIAKASIVATLPARTAVLAGGNPKFSRFDTYMPISKQIIIPDTLLSRFDLKFALRDTPDAAMDKRIVDHVLMTREDDYAAAKPKLDRDFVRKYIAYAKDKCHPTLTREAGKYLRNFYLKTRKKTEGKTDAIPITMRQFEALIRLSEASAKVQLQKEVRKEDAQRAIKLMKFSLMQLGMDPETGEIDIDRAEGATTSSERSRIRVILDLINRMSETKKELSLDDIRNEAVRQGVEEKDIDEVIEKLKSQGLLFEPSPGFVQKV